MRRQGHREALRRVVVRRLQGLLPAQRAEAAHVPVPLRPLLRRRARQAQSVPRLPLPQVHLGRHADLSGAERARQDQHQATAADGARHRRRRVERELQLRRPQHSGAAAGRTLAQTGAHLRSSCMLLFHPSMRALHVCVCVRPCVCPCVRVYVIVFLSDIRSEVYHFGTSLFSERQALLTTVCHCLSWPGSARLGSGMCLRLEFRSRPSGAACDRSLEPSTRCAVLKYECSAVQYEFFCSRSGLPSCFHVLHNLVAPIGYILVSYRIISYGALRTSAMYEVSDLKCNDCSTIRAAKIDPRYSVLIQNTISFHFVQCTLYLSYSTSTSTST